MACPLLWAAIINISIVIVIFVEVKSVAYKLETV